MPQIGGVIVILAGVVWGTSRRRRAPVPPRPEPVAMTSVLPERPVLVAPDSFKGTLRASEVAGRSAAAWSRPG